MTSFRFREPWSAIDESAKAVRFVAELSRELPVGHVLAEMQVRPIASRQDQDDVLFELGNGNWAVVHLTWHGSRERDPRYPRTTILTSAAAVQERLHQDAFEFEPWEWP